jgi:hypothetical protein
MPVGVIGVGGRAAGIPHRQALAIGPQRVVVRRPRRVIHVRQAVLLVIEILRHHPIAACEGGPVAVLVVAVGSLFWNGVE